MCALAISADGSLYVGGDFDHIGHHSLSASDIARWDGRRWHALGTGVNGNLNQLAVSGNTVYAVGDFTRAGGVIAKGIARWNGRAWSAVGNGVGPQNADDFSTDNGRLYAVAVNGTDVYVGGDISKAGILLPIDIAALTPRGWRALGQGFGLDDFGPGSPSSVAVDDRGYVYLRAWGFGWGDRHLC